ncbi:MAG: hypothetical protein AAB214_16310 [Fibrobacterota bacterium]
MIDFPGYLWTMRKFPASTAILIPLMCLALSGAASAQWSWRVHAGPSFPVQDLAKFEGTYYGMNRGNVLLSEDLDTWRSSPAPFATGIESVTTGDSTWLGEGNGYLMVFKGAKPLTSTSYGGMSVMATTYDGSRFVAMCLGQKMFTYSHAAGWTETSGTGIQYSWDQTRETNGIAWGNGQFLLSNRGFRTAGADLKWSVLVPEGTVKFTTGPVFTSGLFVMADSANRILTSADGIQWTPRTLARKPVIRRLAVRQSNLFAIGDSGTILRSANGIEWAELAKPCNACGVADIQSEKGGLLAATSAGICQSIAGDSWTCRGDSTARPKLEKVAFGNGRFLALADSGEIFTSGNGLDWAAPTPLPRCQFFDLLFARGKFHALDAHGEVYSSADGVSWSVSRLGYSYVYTIAEGGGKFLVTASNGLTFVSDSLKTWTQVQALSSRDSSKFTNLSVLGMIHDGKKFIAGSGVSAGMATSVDGKYWRDAGCNISLVGAIAVHDSIGVAVSSLGSVCTSVDGGSSWSKASSPSDAYGLVWADTSFVGAGRGGYGATTRDGKSWRSFATVTESNLNAVAYGDGKLVGVGDRGVIAAAMTWPVSSNRSVVDRARATVPFGWVGLGQGGKLRCDLVGDLSVLDPKGRQILSLRVDRAGQEVALPVSVSGLVVVRLRGASGAFAAAVLVR